MKNLTISKNILNETSTVLSEFFKDIDRYKIYSGEEQKELARQALAGDDSAREKLINSNLKFVVTCAKKYVGQGVPLLDLIQAGAKGLILAVNNYDPDRGYHFISFAVWYIRREILKEIYNTGRTIRYPITHISKITKVKKAYEQFLEQNGREPTDEELIKLTNFTQKQYDSVIMNKSYCQSLETPVSENTTLEDLLCEESGSFSDTFTKDTIEKTLKCLNPREYLVITKYYGLCGELETPIKDIAKELNLGDERVRQIRKNSIKKLKEKCGKILKTLL